MKYKFNPYERAVGFFLSVTVIGSIVIFVGLAIKKNWLEDKVSYVVYTQSAANLRVGNNVIISGLKIGSVEKIELDQDQKIDRNVRVTFSILKKYSNQMTIGSKVQFVRPFIIGDKALSIVKGENGGKLIASGEVIPVFESLDLLDVLGGKQLEGMLTKVENILNNMDQTILAGKEIAIQINDKKKLKKTLEDLHYSVAEVRRVMPYLTSQVPEASGHVGKIIENLSVITSAFKELQPEGAKTIELLHESVITLKAMQKSMLLRGSVEEVKEEMAAKRVPAEQK